MGWLKVYELTLIGLAPPAEPMMIAANGKAVFEATCSRCHGTYGPDGVYPSELVPSGIEPAGGTTASFVTFIQGEQDRLGRVARSAKMTAEPSSIAISAECDHSVQPARPAATTIQASHGAGRRLRSPALVTSPAPLSCSRIWTRNRAGMPF